MALFYAEGNDAQGDKKDFSCAVAELRINWHPRHPVLPPHSTAPALFHCPAPAPGSSAALVKLTMSKPRRGASVRRAGKGDGERMESKRRALGAGLATTMLTMW